MADSKIIWWVVRPRPTRCGECDGCALRTRCLDAGPPKPGERGPWSCVYRVEEADRG